MYYLDTEAHEISYLLEQTYTTAKHILNKAETIISNEVLYKTHRVTGKPKPAIVQFAKEEKADLIIMGATGMGAFTRLLLGSTTAYVVNNAPCNVLIVRQSHATIQRKGTFKKINRLIDNLTRGKNANHTGW